MSSSSVLDAGGTLNTPGRGAKTLIGFALLAGLVFVAGAALPYYSYNETRFGSYWPVRAWLLLHITGGMVALLTGPVQLWLGLSDRRMGLHRRLGVIYMCAIVVSSAAAYYLAFHTQGGWVFGSGLAGLATVWLITTGLAYVAVRRSLYDQHKEWMIRSYVVTFAFVAFRIIFPIVMTLGVGTLNEQLGFAAWSCWALPLIVTEAILQGRKILAVR